jgi:hypothetical protein
MCLSVLPHFFVVGVDIPLFLLKSTAMSTIVWISKGLFAINVTSSAQVGAQQFIFPILPPSPELLNISSSGFT